MYPNDFQSRCTVPCPCIRVRGCSGRSVLLRVVPSSICKSLLFMLLHVVQNLRLHCTAADSLWSLNFCIDSGTGCACLMICNNAWTTRRHPRSSLPASPNRRCISDRIICSPPLVARCDASDGDRVTAPQRNEVHDIDEHNDTNPTAT